jgi:O-antigen/teichoic acid export membrane protein
MAISDDSTESLDPAQLEASAEARGAASARDVGVIARGAGLGIIGGVVREGLTNLGILLLTHLLSPVQWGLVNLAIVVVTILAMLGKGGFNWVVTRLVAIHHAAGDKERLKGDIYGSLFWTTLFSVTLALAVTLTAPWISSLFQKPEFAAPLVAFVWWVPCAGLTLVLVAILLAVGSARPRVVVRDIAVPAVFLVLTATLVVGSRTAVTAGLAYTLSGVVGLALGLYYLYRSFPGLRRVRAVYDHRLLLATAMPMLLTDVAGVGVTQADVLVAGRLLSVVNVGLYGAASRVALLATIPMMALIQIQAPVISRLHHQGQIAELDAQLKTFTRLCLTASAPLVALLIGLAGPVLGILGPRFAAAAPALEIASVGVLVNVSTASVGVSLLVTGYQWLAFAANVGAMILLVGLVWWLTPLYGIVGAAVGFAAAMSAANLARLVMQNLVLRVNPWSLAMLKSLAAAAVSGSAAWGLARLLGLTGREGLGHLVPAVLGLTVVSLALYLGLILLLGVEQSDKEAARALGERLRRR